MSFKINPVRAAVKAHQDGNCGVHAMNSACYDVCAAFKGTDSPWGISDECNGQCEMLVEQLRKDVYGLGYCDHHAPNRPVLWDQTPSFFPEQFKKYKNVPQALAHSLEMCKKTAYPEQCKQRALLHSYAVENSTVSNLPNNPVEGYADGDDNHHHHRHSDDDNDFSDLEKSHSWAFWLGFSVMVVFFAIFFVILIKILLKK